MNFDTPFARTSKKSLSVLLSATLLLQTLGSLSWAKPAAGEIQKIQMGDRGSVSYIQIVGKNLGDYYSLLNHPTDGPPKLFVTFYNTHLAHDVEPTRTGNGSIAEVDAEEITNDKGVITQVILQFSGEETYQIKKIVPGASLLIEVSKTNVPAPAMSQPVVPTPEVHMIRAGDSLYISVSPADELSRDVTVDENGKISVPLLGAIEVTGQTAENLAQTLTRKLARYVTNPHVDILVKQSNAQQISITGQVHAPGVYNFRPNMRLLDLISVAGGFTPAANKRQVRIYHGTGVTRRLTVLNAEEVLQSGDVTKDFTLEPGDIVEVPKGDTAITIFGEVNHTGTFDYLPNMRMLDLISASDGFKDGANLTHIKVFRGEPPNQKVLNTRFDKVLNGHPETDFVLQPGDKVYVMRRSLWSYSALANTLSPIATLILTGATLALAVKK